MANWVDVTFLRGFFVGVAESPNETPALWLPDHSGNIGIATCVTGQDRETELRLLVLFSVLWVLCRVRLLVRG